MEILSCPYKKATLKTIYYFILLRKSETHRHIYTVLYDYAIIYLGHLTFNDIVRNLILSVKPGYSMPFLMSHDYECPDMIINKLTILQFICIKISTR